MSRCEVCQNDYDRSFEVSIGGSTHTFDSFECAIHALAPQCEKCGLKIVGHGVQSGEHLYCCAHCAEKAGQSGITDRV